MMKRKGVVILSLFAFTAFCIIFMEACKKSDTDSSEPGPTLLSFTIPKGFPATQYDFEGNPITKEGFELGRRLFYDGSLSKDGNFPCASCHQQFAAFATSDHDLSHGFNNQFTTRNAPGMYNLAWHKEFHWDGGINHLDVQPLAPITATNEMAEEVNNVLNKLRLDPLYPKLFKSAFGSDEISSQRMLWALSQFMVMMVSANSKYDKIKRGEASFSTYERLGYEIFKAKCASCHTEPLLTDLSYRNNGLALNTFLKDYGRMQITHNSQDSLKFKVPSLRNVELTKPYMHDGRFWTLQAVLDHYSSGVRKGPTLDPSLDNGISLSASDKVALTSFLKTLTDTSFTKDPRFSEPSE